MVRACRVLHEAKLGCVAWGFVATRDALGRGIWITRDNIGFDEITVEDLVLISFEGAVVQVAGQPDNEWALAVDVMAARRDMHAVVHAHSLYATAFAATNRSLEAISHEGCHLVPPEVARISELEKHTHVAESLGLRNAILTRGHGLLTVAESLGEAVALSIYLEKACQLQLMAGDDVHLVTSDQVLEKRSGQIKRPRISWEYLQRVSPKNTSSA
jgi:L-fuculose-phosphate aldolase